VGSYRENFRRNTQHIQSKELTSKLQKDAADISFAFCAFLSRYVLPTGVVYQNVDVHSGVESPRILSLALERLVMTKASSALISIFVLAAFGAIHQQQQAANQQSTAQQQQTTQQHTSQQSADGSAAKPAATPRLEFDVAEIKPADPKEQGGGIKADPGGQTYHAQGAPVQLMIQLMWKLNPSQIVGGPDWLKKDLWDVEAKADHSYSLDDLHAMFQNMIIDRFNMKFHWDTRDLPMYALTVEKSGAKLKENSSPETFNIPIQFSGFLTLKATHCDLKYFTWSISQFPWVGRPVVDQTGLDKSKFYDFTLAFEPELPAGVDRSRLPAQADGPDFFTAIREQLGLQLEAKKGPVPVMVIDSIAKPSESDQ
jgi:uncharacterized protein (TIGR03435 family)